MIFLTAFLCVLFTFMLYVKMSMDNIQKLTDKVMAGDYKEYKREQRADTEQKMNMEEDKKTSLIVEEVDKDYL